MRTIAKWTCGAYCVVFASWLVIGVVLTGAINPPAWRVVLVSEPGLWAAFLWSLAVFVVIHSTKLVHSGRPRSFVRRSAKWLGLATCGLVTAAWIGSEWWRFHVTITPGQAAARPQRVQTVRWLRLEDGRVCYYEVLRTFVHLPKGARIFRDDRSDRNYPAILYYWSGLPPNIAVPLWAVLVVGGVLTVFLWHRDHAPPGFCRRCGYNLTGLPEPRCPECGAAIEVTSDADA